MGYAFADDRVSEFAYTSPRTLLDFELVLFEPAEILQDLRISSWYEGAPVVGASDSRRLLAALERRQNEFAKVLELGRTVVVFVPAPDVWYYSTGRERNEGTAAKPRIINVVDQLNVGDWLPSRIETVRAVGAQVELRDGGAFRDFWVTESEQFQYAAYVSEWAARTTLVIKDTDYPVAGVEQVGDGTILWLPRLDGWKTEVDDLDESDATFDPPFVSTLLELVVATRATGAVRLPEWSGSYVVPGEARARSAEATAQIELDEALRVVDERKSELEQSRAKKVLFTGTGVPLERQVREVFQALGCEIENDAPGRSDLIVRWNRLVAVVEVKGLSKSASERNAAQLEKWVSEYYDRTSERPKGILLVNAYRTKPLADRPETAFPEQMLAYATAREHCLITSIQLLGLWSAHRDGVAADELLEGVFAKSGVYTEFRDWNEFVTHEGDDQQAEPQNET
jgi:hypothetical protein